jgi:hypothetical protein
LSTAAQFRYFSKGNESALPTFAQGLLDDALTRITPFVLDALRSPANMFARFNSKPSRVSR